LKLVNASAYLHGLREMCAAWRSKPTGCDIVHHIPSIPVGVVSDAVPAALQAENVWHYFDVAKRVAAGRHGYLDTDEEWHDQAFTLGFLPNNSPHETLAGMTDITTRLGSRLGL
jgi:hypothetical protein